MSQITEETRQMIKDFAYDSFDCGHVMDIDDYDVFASLLREDGIEPSRDLFELYYEYVDEARYEYYYGRDDDENDDLEDDEDDY